MLKVRERSLGFEFVAYSLLSEPSEREASKGQARRERTDGSTDQDQFHVDLFCGEWRGEDRQRDEDASRVERGMYVHNMYIICMVHR